jgi:putative transposase
VKTLLQSFLLMLSTASHGDLIETVEYLKAENRILRAKLPRRLTVTARERRTLLQYGRRLGTRLKEVISIVSARTFARWLKGDAAPVNGKRPAGPGRLRTADGVRALVLQLARENGWGYTRILGELKKLGVGQVSRSTVVNILKEHGLETGPRRGAGTWDNFLRRHAATLWACDFFTARVWTLGGVRDVFVLFFLHIGSRRVHVAGMSAHPDRDWTARQAHEVVALFAELPEAPKYLLRDRDGKFGEEFDAVFAAAGIAVKPVGPLAPNMNAHAERWVGSIRRECLDHFVVLGEGHLRHLVLEYAAYYNEARPHQGVGNVPLMGATPVEEADVLSLVEVRCAERLGGLLRHYFRPAA